MKTTMLSALMVALSVAGSLGQQRNDTISWLKESAFDLRTTNPSIDITGVPFPAILQNADLVLAGEATHGTKEFAQIKHRLFRYLVQHLKFRYFLIEADFAAALTVDNYICNNTGDPADALRSLRYFHIVNQEGLELIKWMRSYNDSKSTEEQIRFFGIDCQTSEQAFQQLKNYIADVDPAFYKQVEKYELTNNANWKFALDKKYPTLTLNIDSISRIRSQFLKHKNAYVTASSEQQYKIAARLIEVLKQSNEISTGPDGFRTREKAMTENVFWILNEIDAKPDKAFLWAHNLHVRYSEVTDRNGENASGTLGMMLRNRFGEKVYSIGIDFNKGSFIANEIRLDSIVKTKYSIVKTKYSVDQVPANTFSSLLSEVGRDVLFIDFNSLTNPNLIHWLKNNRVKLQSNIGGTYYPQHRFIRFSLMNDLDGLIFINKTNEITMDLR